MNRLQKLLIAFSLISFFAVFYSCDGIFPTAPKNTVPSDHTDNIGGALHKGSGREMNPDECDDCHTLDIRGKITRINGVYTWAPSCYQCHGAVWERNGEGGNNGY